MLVRYDFRIIFSSFNSQRWSNLYGAKIPNIHWARATAWLLESEKKKEFCVKVKPNWSKIIVFLPSFKIILMSVFSACLQKCSNIYSIPCKENNLLYRNKLAEINSNSCSFGKIEVSLLCCRMVMNRWLSPVHLSEQYAQLTESDFSAKPNFLFIIKIYYLLWPLNHKFQVLDCNF
jgi:hypothetical protein